MPVCLYAYWENKTGKLSIAKAIEIVHQTASLTHNHIRSNMACGIYFFMAKEILDEEGSLIERLQKGMNEAKKYYTSDIANLVEWTRYGRMENLSDFAMLPENEIKSSGYVVDSMEAAVWSLITTNSFDEALLKAVNLGRDTDTVGAIAGGLAGLFYGYEGIPKAWKDAIIMEEEIEALCELMEK